MKQKPFPFAGYIPLNAKKCDSVHHYYSTIALTYPPCYDCHCGRHCRFDMKTYMALEKKYGENGVDIAVREYMASGDWAYGRPILDSKEVEKLAGEKYRKFQSSFQDMIKNADTLKTINLK